MAEAGGGAGARWERRAPFSPMGEAQTHARWAPFLPPHPSPPPPSHPSARAAMKDVFQTREIERFFELGHEFAASLGEAFPDCHETKDWGLWLRNVIGDDAAQREATIRKWHEGLLLPLKRGSAKYMKAVQSITGAPALVYHAIAYHDADAVHANDEMMRALDFPSKLAQPCMDERNRAVFWQYLEEMNAHCLAALRATAPAVPTVRELEENIERRRQQRAAGGAPAGPAPAGGAPAGAEPAAGAGPAASRESLQSGLLEVWNRLAAARGVALVHDADDAARLAERVAALAAEACDGGDVAAAAQRRAPAAEAAARRALPELGEAPLDEEQWALLERVLGIAAMQRAIPGGMMRGIEDVASKLVRDIEAGRVSMEALDIEKIGEQVLGTVSTDDVSAFANNIDSILPALQRMGK